jgi:membrane protein YqaA with SNARE-associated domain
MGGFGLLLLGVLDSSFLTMPLGNDLLVVVLSAHRHILMPYYVLMATGGSVLGCLLVDWAGRRGGAEALQKHLRGRMAYVRKQTEKRAGWALAFAALMPPPFPFTPFVLAAAALQYPRRKLLGVIGVARFVRFGIEGGLAIYFGKSILTLAESSAVEHGVVALIVISIAASTFSLQRWIRRASQPVTRASR